ncbi:MCE family protein [Chitinophaga sp. SYP-B3965]|uniref:MlaD family protein n=1 Tax=Chitinophaga sp. SYP-B3965 TaxID=2663120 RepID=UPI001299AEBD|nr:MlaD family protein [Chitinophaga sp. SYP-B3965]MRG44984.1 MCE family protein [Chitinophaga sp. SYP-B3965]
MKDKSTKRTVIVGIFILLGVIIFAVGILTLGGQRKSFVSSIKVKAIFHDIGGLAKGDNVWYSGVKVGTIKSITFLNHSEIEVLMNIETASRQFIHKDVKAKLSSDGLVGNKIIALTGGTATVPAIEDGDIVTVEVAVSTEEIMNTLQVNNKSLVEITGNLKAITGKIMKGEGSIGKLINDEAIYNDLQGTMATLRKTAANTQILTEGLAEYSAKLHSKGTLANDLVSDTVVFHKLRATISQMETIAQGVDSVVLNLRDATTGVKENLRSENSPAGVLLNDEKTAQALKQTISNLQSGTEKLDENMEALQSNFLLRGFFRKKAKREKKEAEQAAQKKD